MRLLRAVTCHSFHNFRRFSLSRVYPKVNDSLQVGSKIHGYLVRQIEEIPELCLTAFHFEHEGSGAEHLHISRDDSNNAFGVSFRTTPTDSTGVAHILEHLSLCGSVKYPCRDPFMKMLHRSLATFMNAFTGPDYTMYPFSTQNPKDFENLLRIYLDAAFFPRLRLVDFRQEGWRLEHEDVHNKSSPIILKGVVYNEMKGVFANASSIFLRGLHNHLLPDITYGNESGGDPLHIPDLTHEQLKNFHAQHYHPSNSRFYTYGNFPIESHLSIINDFILTKFPRNDEVRKSTLVPFHQIWTTPQVKHLKSQSDPLAPFQDRQTTVSVAFLLNDINDTHESFTLAILCSLLCSGPNAPLYQALIESGIGTDYSPGSGFSNHTKQTMFSVGLQGIREKDVDEVTDIIRSSLKKVAKKGFPPERIEALLHSVELGAKHQGSNFGLNLMMAVNPYWNHDGSPINAMRINHHVDRFKSNMKNNPNFLKEKVEQHFVKNTHQLTLIMHPTDNYEEIRQQKEKELLSQKTSYLTPLDKENIFSEGLELESVVQAQEDISVLPTLNVKQDISRAMKITNFDRDLLRDVPVQFSAQPTNGISYFHAVATINPNEIPTDLICYLPLFCHVLTKLGAGNLDRKALDQEIQLRTGGLHASVHVADSPSNCDEFEKGILFSSYCLERNNDAMFNLWSSIFNSVQFDKEPEYLLQLVQMYSTELSMSVPHQGHHYAMQRASSYVSSSNLFRELSSGLHAVNHFRQMSSEDPKSIIKKLNDIAAIVLRKQNLRCAVNAEAVNIRSVLQHLEKFISNVPSVKRSLETDIKLPNQSAKYEHHLLPLPVNYLGKAYYCAPYTHDDYAKLKIAGSLLSAKFLHKEIREKGGAYGGGASLKQDGVFKFYSYQDPNVKTTLKVFNDSIDWLSKGDYSEQDIDEAKLSVFQSVDAPVTPGSQGMRQFIHGISDEMKHNHRMSLLDVTKGDIKEVTQRYLAKSPVANGIVLIGPRTDFLQSEPNWKIMSNLNNIQ